MFVFNDENRTPEVYSVTVKLASKRTHVILAALGMDIGRVVFCVKPLYNHQLQSLACGTVRINDALA